MKIRMLRIRNFKAIRYAELNDLQDVVVIAGLNGCGKSCIFDAIRLIKSSCGGYLRDDEYNLLFEEFQSNIGADGIRKISHDINQPIEVQWEIELSQNEKIYIKSHASDLAREFVLEKYYRQQHRGSRTNHKFITFEDQTVIQQNIQTINDLQKEYCREIEIEKIFDKVTFRTQGNNSFYEQPKSQTLQMIFTIYMPVKIGVIDYHGPHRDYAREIFNTVNFNIEVESEQKMKQSALYNYRNKYANIKQELASSYVKDLIASAAQGDANEKNKRTSLANSLRTLFNVFIPGKEFKGIVPTLGGTLAFPVKIQDGKEHDLDDLSSGEKEVLYGYLRLVKDTPKHSVLLIDEPELHLNPRMIKELPVFYHEHIGIALDNQIWLITHSDSLIRGSVNQENFSVFHMSPHINVPSGSSQVSSISSTDEITSTIINLVGDAATYIPNGKLIIFEGSIKGNDADFDAIMTKTLFPEIGLHANTISAGNKKAVSSLHDILDNALAEGILPFKVYSITDRDFAESFFTNINQRSWDAYHIENYLLDFNYITKTINKSATKSQRYSANQVRDILQACAKESLEFHALHETRQYIYKEVSKSISFNSGNHSNIDGLFDSVSSSFDRINGLSNERLSKDNVMEFYKKKRDEYQRYLYSGDWITKFNGRNILKCFCKKERERIGIRYIPFRNLILSEMQQGKHRPNGMKKIIEEIIADNDTPSRS
ncbi:MAG: AAA family ATPase [Gammaproteobacteria bacterium]|nr:AAA family ATPase [Gammaproteobacteria bacterium]